MDSSTQPALFEALMQRTHAGAESRPHSESTQQAHAWALKRYFAFCEKVGAADPFPLNEDTASAFVLDMADDPADYSPNTVRTYLQAVITRHRELGHPPFPQYFPSRMVRAYREHKEEEGWQPQRKAPLLQDDLTRVMRALRPVNRARDLRDGCAMTLAWAIFGCCAELHWLNLDDVQIMPDGRALSVLVSRRMTEEGAAGAAVEVPAHPDPLIDPVRWTVNWVRWLEHSNGIHVGPLLRPMTNGAGKLKYPGQGWVEDAQIPGGRWSTHAYRQMLKNRCAAVGIPPEVIAGQSMRTGGALSAYVAGAREIEINRHGRWSDGSVSIYHHVRRVDAGRMNPLKAVHADWEQRMRQLRSKAEQESA